VLFPPLVSLLMCNNSIPFCCNSPSLSDRFHRRKNEIVIPPGPSQLFPLSPPVMLPFRPDLPIGCLLPRTHPHLWEGRFGQITSPISKVENVICFPSGQMEGARHRLLWYGLRLPYRTKARETCVLLVSFIRTNHAVNPSGFLI